MNRWGLQTRFILAGCLLIAATVGSSAWSALTFARFHQVVDETLGESQVVVDLSTDLHAALEREDDALVLLLTDDVEKGRRRQQAERDRANHLFHQLRSLIQDPDEAELADALRRKMDAYRSRADDLRGHHDRPGALTVYQRDISPLLHEMVAGCDQLREAKFRSMQQAGIRARDEAARDVWLVGSICVLTVFLGIGVAIWLARSVLVPVHELTAAAEEIRHGNFERRVRFLSTDELGELAGGFNRMAEALTSYRRSSLGEVLAAKNTLEVTLKALPNAVLVFAPDGTLAALNPPARVILIALDAANAVHLSSMPFRPEHRESIRLALNGQSSPARCMDFRESLSVTVEGKPRRFLVTAVPVAEFVPGQFGAAVVLDDITEFARLDELRAELIGVASHELRSPLTALRMNLLMLSEAASDLPRRQQQLLAAAVEGCEELGLTIEELLDVTRIEAGQLRLHRSPVEMGSVVAAVCKSLQTRYDDAQVRLKVVAPPEPLLLLGDPVRLQSVLSNLLTNALKYSPPGATVEIAMASRQNAQGDSPKAVQITVTDQGVGVPEEYRERIFEKFFRVEHHLPSCGKDVRGTGIGLYLCREIVHSHGGTIVCLPGPEGIGTRLAIWLPHQA